MMPSALLFMAKTLYVADYGNYKIRKVDLATGQVQTLAGSGSQTSTDGMGINASFSGPGGIALVGSDLFVTDYWSHKIRKIALGSYYLAGTPSSGDVGDQNATLVASDGKGGMTSKTYTVTVTGVNQAPVFAESNATFTTAENNASASFTITATDPDANTTLVYAKSGPDAGKFDLNASTGILTFTNTPDFEANASAAGNNAFSLTITVTDGEANATQAITVNVTDDPADNPLDLTTGLVAYYPFDGNASDMSGNGNHGTPQNGVALGADRHGGAGKAYSFDGVDDHVSLSAHISSFKNLNHGTVSAWIKTDSIQRSPILAINREGTTDRFVMEMYSGKSRLLVRNGETNLVGMHASDLLNQGNWYQITVTQSGSLSKLHIDGSLITAFTSNLVSDSWFNDVSNTNLMFIGYDKNLYPVHFHGSIDEVRIYDRALSANEVAALYQLENTPPNQAPVFAESNATFTTAENNVTATFVITATDPDANTTLVYSSSGPDADKFDLNASTGTLTFTNAPDYEANASAAGGNAYSVTITVTDGEANATQAITVNVTDDPADNPLDLTSGLVAYYPFDGNASDMSGNGNHGTVFGATLAADRNGNPSKSYSFDGSNDRIGLPNTNDLKLQKISLAMWVKFSDVLGGQIISNESNVAEGFAIDNTSDKKIGFKIMNGSVIAPAGGVYDHTFTATDSFSENSWVFLTATYEGSIKHIYLDGVLSKSENSTVAVSYGNTPTQIGAGGFYSI